SKVNCRTGTGRAAAGDNYVIVKRLIHLSCVRASFIVPAGSWHLLKSLARASRQHQSRGKMFLDFNVIELRLPPKRCQFVRFKASQNRQCPVFANQPVMQKETPGSDIKIVSHRIPMKIDHKDEPARGPEHLAQEFHDLLIAKMMSKKRANYVIKFAIYE